MSSSSSRLERELGRFTPRLERALFKGLRSLKDRVSVDTIARAIDLSAPDVIMGRISMEAVQDALQPSGAIAQDAAIAGGKSGAEIINSAL